MAGWRESRRSDTQKKSTSGSKKKRWSLIHKFDDTPVRVHFSRPAEDYVHPFTENNHPFYVGMRYYVPWGGNGKFGTYIDRGDPVNGNQCVVDAYRNPAALGLDIEPIEKFGPKTIKDAGMYYAVAGWVEEWFHNVECENPKSGAKWRERQLCKGHGCQGCKDKEPKVYGKKVYFIIARSHWNESIFNQEEKANSHCKCGEGSFIYTQQYNCEKCSELLVDVMNACYSCNSTELSLDTEEARAECEECHASWSVYESYNKDLSETVNQEIACGCGHKGYPVPVFQCTYCESPKEYSVFDAQIRISMAASKDGKFKDMVIEGMKIQEPNPMLFDAKYQGDDPEWNEKIAEANGRPIDLAEMLAPPSVEEQCMILGVANPFTESASDQGYKSYKRNDTAPTAPEEAAPAVEKPKKRIGIGKR